MFGTLAGTGVGTGGGATWTNTASGGGVDDHAVKGISAAKAAGASHRTDSPLTPNALRVSGERSEVRCTRLLGGSGTSASPQILTQERSSPQINDQ
jgi:hypothetical protein